MRRPLAEQHAQHHISRIIGSGTGTMTTELMAILLIAAFLALAIVQVRAALR